MSDELEDIGEVESVQVHVPYSECLYCNGEVSLQTVTWDGETMLALLHTLPHCTLYEQMGVSAFLKRYEKYCPDEYVDALREQIDRLRSV